ncbi:MAG: DUF1304 domain-containing protein [Deltaproteobacteria bacterium]|nr:DUF1304 domain-containing protein [Deltaproteobacteria bacterium]
MIGKYLMLLIAIEHVWIGMMEIFRWEAGFAKDLAGLNDAQAAFTTPFAKNQGTYNLFLAAGLMWAYLSEDAYFAGQLRVFFLSCVLVAGLVGWRTVSKRIFFFQGLPALIALALMWVG